jgi:hypothetical protein
MTRATVRPIATNNCVTTKDKHAREELATADGLHAFTPSPMEAGDTRGPPHDQGSLHHWPAVPVGTLHQVGSQHNYAEGALHPPVLSEKRRLCTLRIKAPHQEHHHQRWRLTPLLHREACQICLLNNWTSAYTKEEEDSTTTKQATTVTNSRQILQTTDAGMANQRPEAMPQIRPRRCCRVAPTQPTTNTDTHASRSWCRWPQIPRTRTSRRREPSLPSSTRGRPLAVMADPRHAAEHQTRHQQPSPPSSVAKDPPQKRCFRRMDPIT